MSIKNKIVATVLSGLAVAGFVAATALSNPQAASAQTGVTPPAAKSAVVGERGGPRGGISGHDTYLAQALGITEEALQAAQAKAHEAAIQQAVKDGLITQAQADAMLNKTDERSGVRISLRRADIDNEALLANALGISVEELQAAQESAAKAELAAAVADGRLTQAQADQITAERALAKYVADKGLVQQAVQSAVKDGVITQAQADTILSKDRLDLFGGRGRGLDGGPGMIGGHSGARP